MPPSTVHPPYDRFLATAETVVGVICGAQGAAGQWWWHYDSRTGGVVEGYPQDTQGKKISATFLYNTTRSLYEQTGFTYLRPKGKNHCVMRRTVSPVKAS